jgi:hypothetical protein
MRKPIHSIRLFFAIFSWILPVFAFTSVWLPVIDHYHVKSDIIGDRIVDASRNNPPFSVFKQLESVNFGINLAPKSDNQVIALAEQILEGKIDFPGYPKLTFGMPFNSDDLSSDSLEWALLFAGFALPDVLVRGYSISLRDDFLNAARDFIMAWAEFESKTWLPKGLLWNDHAISNRMVVISKFWGYYRKHINFKTETAKAIFRIVDRGRKLLAKPSHFTFATNHGIMQNLALWHISIAFPLLPNIEYYKNLAFDRMNEQMSFYMSNEGVVLEHSAGYHKMGLELLDITFRYLTWLNTPIPYDWITKYDKARDFYLQLRRPDGSLPVFGDTRSKENSPKLFYSDIHTLDNNNEPLDLQQYVPKESFTLLPVSGYSVWWDQLKDWPSKNKISQTVVIWSNFPGHGHKHADELSVLLWAYGQTWWANSGYLPYGTSERKNAISWIGSNAPHLVDEHPKINRNTELKYFGNSSDVAAIDLERTVQNRYKIRRQVINLFPNIWITIDHCIGNNSPVNTIWTAADNVRLRKGKIPGSFILATSNNNTLELHKYILGSKGIRIHQKKGNRTHQDKLKNEKASFSILVEQPEAESWSAVIWSIKSAQSKYEELTRQPVVQKWNGSENWKILLFFPRDTIIVKREKASVTVFSVKKDSNLNELKLTKHSRDVDKRNIIQHSFNKTYQKYRKPDFSHSRRLKATYYLVIILCLQLIVFPFYKKFLTKRDVLFKILLCLFWIGQICDMQFIYFIV